MSDLEYDITQNCCVRFLENQPWWQVDTDFRDDRTETNTVDSVEALAALIEEEGRDGAHILLNNP